MGPDSRKNFGLAGRWNVSTVAIEIILDLRSKRVCVGWDRFGKSVVPVHVPIWNLLTRWWKQGDSAPHRTVIGRADVLWIQYCISTCTATFPPRVRDAFPMGAFPVVTNHMRVLAAGEFDEGMCWLRWVLKINH